MPRKRQGSVTQGKDELWYGRVRWTCEETAKERDKKFPPAESESDAWKQVHKFLDKLSKGGTKAVNGEKMTFNEYADKFEKIYLVAPEYRNGIKVKGVHLRGTKAKMKAYREFFGNRKLISIRHSDIETFKTQRLNTPVTKTDKPRAIATVNRELALLRKIFNLAKRDGVIHENPFEGGGLISAKAETARDRVLSLAEETRLLEACGARTIEYERYGKEITAEDDGECRKHLKSFLICALDTAMRAGEISKLEWRDIDLKAKIITVRAENCKTGKSRRIPIMSDRLMEEFLALKAAAPDDPNALVLGFKSVRKSFATACKAAKIEDFRIHDCRHTTITRWIDSGMEHTKAMKYSGHTVMTTFLRYLNLKDEEMQRDAADFKVYDEKRRLFSKRDFVAPFIEATDFIN